MIHVTTVRGNACHHTKTNVTICTLVAAFGHLSCYENMFVHRRKCMFAHTYQGDGKATKGIYYFPIHITL